MLAESLFHQILVRTIKWTQLTYASSPKLSYRRGKFNLDDQHQLILSASSMKYARMKVQILRTDPSANNPLPTNATTSKSHEETNQQLADPTIVAKVNLQSREPTFLFK